MPAHLTRLCLLLSLSCLLACSHSQHPDVDRGVEQGASLPVAKTAAVEKQQADSTTTRTVTTDNHKTVPDKTATPVLIAEKPVQPVVKPAVEKSGIPIKSENVPGKTPLAKPAVENKKEPEMPVVIPAEAKPDLGGLKGTVTIMGKNSEKLPANEVIVNLEPLFPVAAAKGRLKTHQIKMDGKKYTPSVMSIQAGDTVNFKNMDAIKHNVFSSSGSNAFELGTYGFGVTEGAVLKHPGIVKVYCNIHAEMAAFISIGESGYSFITETNGEYYFNDVPAGEYLLKVWHVRGEDSKKIRVSANEKSVLDVVLNTASYTPETHLNKLGKPYTINPTLFNDEFY